jgi:hypothetical protein
LAPDIDISGNLLFKGDLGLLTLDDKRGKLLVEANGDTRKDPEGGELLNAGIVAGADIGDTGLFTQIESIERGDERVELRPGPATTLSGGDGTLVRAEAGVPEEGTDRFGDATGEEVLKLTGIGLALLDGHAEDIDDESLSESMTANDLLRGASPFRRQAEFALRGPGEQSSGLRLSEEVGGDLGPGAVGDALLAGRSLLLGRPDGLQQLNNLIRQTWVGHHD